MNDRILQAMRGWVGLVTVALVSSVSVAEETPPRPIEFNRDIRPILSDACFHCHGPDKAKRKANLRLDTEEGALADLGDRFAIVRGDPEESELVYRITSEDVEEKMPPHDSGRELRPEHVELLKRWVAEGAPWQKHWSLIPPERPAAPTVQRGEWVRNPIDAFILARLESEGLPPSPEAEKTTLIGGATLDLTGLPPTLGEVDAFVTDTSPDAYEKLVDRLLASPRYGERMALEWLDAARYADSNGYQGDMTRTLWPWRDWVINALNANMPFDQFTVEQIAGDLLPEAATSQKVASGFHRNHMLNGEGERIPEESRVDYVVDRVDTTATVRLGLTLACVRCHDHKFDSYTQKEYYSLYAYFNNIDESGSVDRNGNAAPVLELPTPEQSEKLSALRATLGEIEPKLQAKADELGPGQGAWESATQAELAAPLAKLTAAAQTLGTPVTDEQRQAILDPAGKIATPADVLEALLTPAEKRSDDHKTKLREHYLGTSTDYRDLKTKADETRKAIEDLDRSLLRTMVMQERAEPRESFVLIRGAYNQYGEKVTPGVPEALPPLPSDAPANRLGLARWLVDQANPLTSRVTVNRFWQTFFGTGIVKTVEDFGVQGEPPSHPELLNWLAREFIESGWDVKRVHQLIVTSATYRQASRVTSELRERDPDNRLLARGPRQRLSSLLLRDQALALGGHLVEKLGGPPVKPYQPAGIWEEMSFNQIKYEQGHGDDLYRRSLYTFWRRTVGPPDLFDTSMRQTCNVRQVRTNTPLQALVLMNDVAFVEAARGMAQRLLAESGSTSEERIDRAFRLATARPPNDAERVVLRRALERFLAQYQSDPEAAAKLVTAGESPRDMSIDPVELAAYTALANLVLNLDEVITKE